MNQAEESYDKIWKKQEALPGTRTYYVTMVRPRGSFIWTQHGDAFPNEPLGTPAVEGIDDQWEMMVIPIELPRMPCQHAYQDA